MDKPEIFFTQDWEKLSDEQRKAMDAWRKRVGAMVLAEVQAFEQEHPELRISYNFVSDVLLRANHPIVLQEL